MEIYQFIQALMLGNSGYLFEQILPSMNSLLSQWQKSRLRNNFIVNKNEVQLTLTSNHIVLSDAFNFRQPTHQCPLQFDTKYEVIYNMQTESNLGTPIAIKLEREGCQQQLIFYSQATVIETWALQLEKKINQRGFHKLFKAKRKIGKGAFATVYLAERIRDKKLVAVKAFSKQKQYAGDKGKQSLQNQIKLMRRLNHINVMKLQGVYETQNSIYVIVQYLQGPQLNQLLKSGAKIQPQDAKAIIKNILNGLNHLAKNRIIHRDLKPQNIMFRKSNDWDLALCDFGLATYADQQKYLFVRCGTPGFVAPQIINIRDMSSKSQPISDIFSAGIIFHHLLLGCSVFEGKKYNQILAQNRACEFDFSKQIYKKLNPKSLDLLALLLQKDPKKRPNAQQALSHTYFNNEMDIESSIDIKVVTKQPFSVFNNKVQTPTTIKNQQKKYIGQNKTINIVRPYLFS